MRWLVGVMWNWVDAKLEPFLTGDNLLKIAEFFPGPARLDYIMNFFLHFFLIVVTLRTNRQILFSILTVTKSRSQVSYSPLFCIRFNRCYSFSIAAAVPAINPV